MPSIQWHTNVCDEERIRERLKVRTLSVQDQAYTVSSTHFQVSFRWDSNGYQIIKMNLVNSGGVIIDENIVFVYFMFQSM